MRSGALLIHGFAGRRDDMWPLAERLAVAGYAISIPLLPGHEGNQKEFARATRREWREAVLKEYQALKKQCDNVIVIGHSMGGLLGITICNHISQSVQIEGNKLQIEKLSTQRPEPAALVTINTPMFYWNMPQIVKNIISKPAVFFIKYLTSGKDKPLRALKEFLMFLKETKLEVSKVKSPLMVIQTLDDDTVKPISAEFIQEKLKGTPEICHISTGGHMVLQTEGAEEVCDIVLKFAKKHLE